jgi:hypothetical protein
MHKITRSFWDRGLTLRKWARLNNFNWRYVELVIAGRRGSWGVGTAKKIKDALVSQGFASEADFNKEV